MGNPPRDTPGGWGGSGSSHLDRRARIAILVLVHEVRLVVVGENTPEEEATMSPATSQRNARGRRIFGQHLLPGLLVLCSALSIPLAQCGDDSNDAPPFCMSWCQIVSGDPAFSGSWSGTCAFQDEFGIGQPENRQDPVNSTGLCTGVGNQSMVGALTAASSGGKVLGEVRGGHDKKCVATVRFEGILQLPYFRGTYYGTDSCGDTLPLLGFELKKNVSSD
jgi:hypothetical protein